ncbi:hypothetical protein D3C71_1448030 [compost metagenome]
MTKPPADLYGIRGRFRYACLRSSSGSSPFGAGRPSLPGLPKQRTTAPLRHTSVQAPHIMQSEWYILPLFTIALTSRLIVQARLQEPQDTHLDESDLSRSEGMRSSRPILLPAVFKIDIGHK